MSGGIDLEKRKKLMLGGLVGVGILLVAGGVFLFMMSPAKGKVAAPPVIPKGVKMADQGRVSRVKPSEQVMPFVEKKKSDGNGNASAGMNSGGMPMIPQGSGRAPNMGTPPMIPNNVTSGGNVKTVEGAKSSVSVSGVMIGAGGNTAMLGDGRMVAEGDEVFGSKIVSIDKNGIILDSGDVVSYVVKVEKASGDMSDGNRNGNMVNVPRFVK